MSVAQHARRVALTVEHSQLEAEVLRSILHVAGILAPERLIGMPRIEEHDGGRSHLRQRLHAAQHQP